MTQTYVIDTHALVWHLTNSPRLGDDARRILIDPSAALVLPAMALVEARFLSQRGRIPLTWEDIAVAVDRDSRCSIRPVDRDVAERLPAGLNIHDAVICATAFVCRDSLGEDVAGVTRDRKIIASGLVPTVW